MSESPSRGLVPMGKFLKPWGLNGELRVTIFNEIDSALKIGMEIWVETETGVYSTQKIESLNIVGNNSRIKLTGCNKREEAEKLHGFVFSLPRNEFIPLEGKEFYLIDLIGCKVSDENENSIGKVVDTISLPAQNHIVVEAEGNEILIPFVDAHISLFDEKKKILIVKDVEGLLN